MTTFDDELGRAREAGDDLELANALVKHAAALGQEGAISEARAELDEAAAIHRRLGNPVDEAICLHSAATLCRAEGELDGAVDRARRAEALAPAATPTIVAACMEQGETSMLLGQHANAEECYSRALDHGRQAGLEAEGQAAALRRRAQARAAHALDDAVVVDLREARELYQSYGEAAAERRTRIEEATALVQLGRDDELEALVRETTELAEAAGDRAVQAELELLAATRAIASGELQNALAAARRARGHSLAGPDPIGYIGAALAVSDICLRLDDRVGAYESLAVGWVTLGDQLGMAVAGEVFRPKLEELREDWGVDGFAAVKAAYESTREQVVKD